jgi:D-alanyl-lipoteichoic acid acyltransferase DltB (MBOAT superfamily)
MKLGVFYAPFSVCNVSIVRYKVMEMQLCTALGYLCLNHEIIGICLVLCPFVMKFPKFTVYSGVCKALNDVVQVNLKHMMYQCGKGMCPLWAVFLNFECLSCILIA